MSVPSHILLFGRPRPVGMHMLARVAHHQCDIFVCSPVHRRKIWSWQGDAELQAWWGAFQGSSFGGRKTMPGVASCVALGDAFQHAASLPNDILDLPEEQEQKWMVWELSCRSNLQGSVQLVRLLLTFQTGDNLEKFALVILRLAALYKAAFEYKNFGPNLSFPRYICKLLNLVVEADLGKVSDITDMYFGIEERNNISVRRYSSLLELGFLRLRLIACTLGLREIACMYGYYVFAYGN
ncbi:hypothetical protein BDR03DRAFT_985297 [Suillus americanus]|nr:hypothetical protein BDR03DRAFT_985297 [Suillus americanus]